MLVSLPVETFHEETVEVNPSHVAIVRSDPSNPKEGAIVTLASGDKIRVRASKKKVLYAIQEAAATMPNR